jgi:hypothetical protein
MTSVSEKLNYSKNHVGAHVAINQVFAARTFDCAGGERLRW